MKRILLLVGLVLIGMTTVSAKTIGKKELPKAVRETFYARYPYLKGKLPLFSGVKWYTMNKQQYYAAFSQKGKEIVIAFAEDGSWLETATELYAEDIPEFIQTILAKNYKGYDIFGAEKVISSNGAEYYRIEMDNGSRSILSILNYDGGLLAEEKTSY